MVPMFLSLLYMGFFNMFFINPIFMFPLNITPFTFYKLKETFHVIFMSTLIARYFTIHLSTIIKSTFANVILKDFEPQLIKF
jgi:hypothetical protein